MELITTIQFKSTKDNFRKESSGIKNNTVRVFNVRYISDAREVEEIEYNQEYIKYIRIVCDDSKQSFVRQITDITQFESHGLFIYIFSW